MAEDPGRNWTSSCSEERREGGGGKEGEGEEEGEGKGKGKGGGVWRLCVTGSTEKGTPHRCRGSLRCKQRLG